MWNDVDKKVADALNMPVGTVRLNLEDLMLVGALKRTVEGESETSPYLWQLSQQLCDWIGQARVFENVKL